MEEKIDWFHVVKGVLLSLGVSWLLTVVFAVILRLAPLSEALIYTINQCIKGVCIIVGTLAFVRGEKGWLKGGCVALFFTALSYLAFSALGGTFAISWIVLLEVLVALLLGAVSGILAVNLQEK
ncbi:MAG: TIGR04086 family membrane protein [Clostridia bacterium]|nr:TIGR04086 family membrane protein [Clostridia bacterium]